MSARIIAALGGLLFTSAWLPAADQVNFGSEIYPILRDHCLKCHGAPYVDARSGRMKKPKGGLRLDTQAHILAGFVNDDDQRQAVLVPGSPEKSPLYTTTTLSPDHDDIMPATGEPLTRAQQELLRQWVVQGAKFGDFKAPPYVNPKAKTQ